MSLHLLPYRRMPLRRAITGVILIVALVTLTAPALAGVCSWSSLDEPPAEDLVDTTESFGVLV